jgi:predicted Zn finger-like uncharacterized protein
VEPEPGVKFLCDLCKTRYSIGDDRVRGKILKIRCKNCTNIITVREGMPPIEEVYGGRTKPATTISPAAHEERANESVVAPIAAKPAAQGRTTSAAAQPRAAQGNAARGQGAQPAADSRRAEPVNALNAAFASAMAKPPPALEEEWYVSIDGAQAGPFSLAEAQRWVGQKAFDAELHCWSEGFDDWLPVDKVSHFRGLRKRPVPAPAPPALPRVAGTPRAAVAAPAAAPDSESPPLFAATMASLERGAPTGSSAGIQLPSATPARATSARAGAGPGPGGGGPGAGAGPGPGTGPGTGPGPGPGPGMNGAQLAEPRAAAAKPRLTPRPGADARVQAASPSGGSGPARKQPADLFDRDEPAESETQLLVGSHGDPFAGAGAGRVEAWPGALAPHLPSMPSTPQGTGGNATAPGSAGSAAAPGDGDDGELHIGEVSRVVNLADLARTPRITAGPARRAATGAVTRMAGASPAQRATSPVPSLVGAAAGMDGAPAVPAEVDPSLALAQAPDTKSHRRGLVALLSFATVLVLGVGAAVVLFVVGNDDLTGNNLGRVRDIDTSRPEDPITKRPLPPGAVVAPANPFIPRPVQPRPNTVVPNRDLIEPTPGNSLRSEEIEDMARKHQDMTQRCYMRSQRGVDAILVGDVKKIAVTLTIDKDGNVSNVGLSEHADNNLGKCLINSMKSWRFRSSAGGAFRFSLNFVSG